MQSQQEALGGSGNTAVLAQEVDLFTVLNQEPLLLSTRFPHSHNCQMLAAHNSLFLPVCVCGGRFAFASANTHIRMYSLELEVFSLPSLF